MNHTMESAETYFIYQNTPVCFYSSPNLVVFTFSVDSGLYIYTFNSFQYFESAQVRLYLRYTQGKFKSDFRCTKSLHGYLLYIEICVYKIKPYNGFCAHIYLHSYSNLVLPMLEFSVLHSISNDSFHSLSINAESANLE